jgi:hypothetical protein
VTLREREKLILFAALSFALANLDEVNSAYEDEDRPDQIRLAGSALITTPLQETEVDNLHDRLLAELVNFG